MANTEKIRITLEPIVAMYLKDTLDGAIMNGQMSIEAFRSMTILSAELGRNIRTFNKSIDQLSGPTPDPERGEK